MDKLKVGVVGIRRGGNYMKNFGRGDRSEITAICDLNETSLEQSSKDCNLADNQCFTDFDEFLNADIDAVVVGTPIPFHAEQTVKALDAGKHVFSEVTASNTIEGCQAIYDAAKRSTAKYMLAENYIYYDYIQQWKKYIDAGKIGNIHYAEGEYIHDIRNLLIDNETGETFWRTYRPPIHYCTHCLGPIMFLIGNGDYITKATAWGNKNTIQEGLWPSTIDMQVALFETKQGRIVKICRSQVTPREPSLVTYNIYGTKGSLEASRHSFEGEGRRYFEGSDPKYSNTIPIISNQTAVDAPLFAAGGHGSSDYFISQAFLDYVQYGKEPYTTVDVAMELTIPGLIAHEAAVQGHVWLDVPRIN
ncbi:MAG: Gfo/Idh/MocA family oxidoreductase [Clostridiales bacterium]|nr:Gfo/Idh/MocA family oxidoreductase [Clostridiales bacterium]